MRRRRILGGKILERSVGRGSVALRLLHQSDRVVAPETFVLELCIRHRCRRTFLQNIKRGQVSMKTRSVRLKFKSFAKRLLGFLVPTCPDRDSAEIKPKFGKERV